MAFNPLGNFTVAAELDQNVVVEAQRFLAALPAVPAGAIDRIYAHWSVGHYGQNFSDYNVSVRFENQHFHLDITHDPRDNARGGNDSKPAYHTYYRNTGAVGITTDGMAGASEHDFGTEPVTVLQLEYLCAGIAALAKKYGIDIMGSSSRAPYAGEPNVLTHAEAADRPGNPPNYAPYGPGGTVERWDLSSFIAFPEGLKATPETASQCGDALRQRAHAYKVALK